MANGAAEEDVRGAVGAWAEAEGRALDFNVEFGDEYGYQTAVDLFGAEADVTLDPARELAQAFPGCDIAVDVDLEETSTGP